MVLAVAGVSVMSRLHRFSPLQQDFYYSPTLLISGLQAMVEILVSVDCNLALPRHVTTDISPMYFARLSWCSSCTHSLLQGLSSTGFSNSGSLLDLSWCYFLRCWPRNNSTGFSTEAHMGYAGATMSAVPSTRTAVHFLLLQVQMSLMWCLLITEEQARHRRMSWQLTCFTTWQF